VFFLLIRQLRCRCRKCFVSLIGLGHPEHDIQKFNHITSWHRLLVSRQHLFEDNHPSWVEASPSCISTNMVFVFVRAVLWCCLPFHTAPVHQRNVLAFYDVAMIMIFTCDGCSDLGKPGLLWWSVTHRRLFA
jgi:hypothetical protein